MTKKRSTKSALISSVLALFLCFTMLLGTTYAWFTDSVTSAGNIIQSGTLDVSMEWLKGTEEPSDDAEWIDASTGAIFNSDKWEPGYAEVRHIKIANEGTLALKYSVAIQANGVVSELADAIDVYYLDPAKKIGSAAELTDENKLGTLTEVLANLNSTGAGVLEAGEKDTVTLALKMRESADNRYQNLSIGANFSIVLIATQYTAESDSFGNQYDANAPKLFTVNGVGYDTAEEALAAANDGDKVYLSGVNNPFTVDKAIELTIANTNILAGGVSTIALAEGDTAENTNAITVNANATIVVEGNNVVTGGKNGDGIYVAEGKTLTLTGSGNLIARGNAGLEYFRAKGSDGVERGEHISNTTDSSFVTTGGSGIEVAGDLVIDGLANLTAEGYGIAGFGIGGATDSIVIKNTTVNYARGGFVCAEMFLPDWAMHLYGKKEPEGAPAIGTMNNDAVIEITNSTVHKAEGGSKGAGIGARYHTGVTVKITDSTVTAFGGNASAGIGGSRVDGNPIDAHAITVNIVNSKINATGGDYAAGIGSGYNTHADKMNLSPKTTVTIDEKSEITAQGGWLGAGIGTGHNVLNFEGDIKCDTTNVKAGNNVDDCCHGALCTDVNDIGLGAYKISALYTSVNGYANLFTDGKNYYVYDATGLISMRNFWKANWNGNDMWGRSYNVMADINAEGYTWDNVWVNVGSNENDGFVFDGHGHTITGLTINGGLFSGTPNGGNKPEAPGVVKDITFDGVTVIGDHFTGVLWSNVYNELIVENVTVKNSTITGNCNVAALVGGTVTEGGDATVTFKDCVVKDNVITANGKEGQDPNGAAVYLSRAFGQSSIKFEGTNISENNTVVNNNGLIGGGIYGYTAWGIDNFAGTGSCNEFTDWNGLAVVSTQETFNSALANATAGQVIKVNDTIELNGEKGSYVELNKDVVIKDGTVKGCGYTGELNYAFNATSGNIVFENVTFVLNKEDIQTGNWGMSVNISGTANVTFRNCTFKGDQCPIYQSGAETVVTFENCKFDTDSVAIQSEIYNGDFQLGQDLIVKNCDFTGVTDVLHIYDYDKDPSSEAIAQYLTENGNIFTGTCKQTCT